MNSSGPARNIETSTSIDGSALSVIARDGRAGRGVAKDSHLFFLFVWYGVNLLLSLAILLMLYAASWEYSTRRYLKGFSDAIVPIASSPQEKIVAILNWMSEGPARRIGGPSSTTPNRDPVDTLNYASLLKVCGTATNAFINLADSAGLVARRLLLLDSHRKAKHVVAEVLVDGHWIIVDPAFRAILRGPNGELLTRRDLVDPANLMFATRDLPDYDPTYTYDNTAHIRLARLPVVGAPLRVIFNRIAPGWEDSAELSLLLERDSLALTLAAFILAMALILIRASVRRYGEERLGMRPIRIRRRIKQAFFALLSASG